MTEAITQQIESDPEFEEAQTEARQNALVPVDPDQPLVEVRVTLYETRVTSAAILPGTPAQFDAGDPSAIPAIEPTAMYTSLVYGLTTAACGDLSSDLCYVSQVEVAQRRRRLQAASASTVTVSFVVTSAVDIADNVAPDNFGTAFVDALANEPNGALTSITLDDVSVEQPDIETDIAYVIVSADTAVSTSAARTNNDDAVVQKSLNAYTDGSVAISCKSCDSIIERNTATPMIWYVVVFFVLLSIVWVVGILAYGRQTGAATLMKKVEAVAEAIANPMFDAAEAAGDVVEAAADVSTAVVKETVDATAVEAVKKTGKAAKKGGKKAAKTAVAVANPMYDEGDD